MAAAVKLARDERCKRQSVVVASASGGKRPSTAVGRTPDKVLLRKRHRQGPPYKCGLIREMLWDWFVDIRRSLATTISPKFLLMKAREIAGTLLREQRELGAFEPMPCLDKHWLLRFKRDKGIVFRKPNCRYKCSKAMLLKRLRAMWLNLFRVRRVAERFLKKDLSTAIYGIDEKPIHFNESGSKAVRTLEIAGAPAVRLKQNHAATRERVSVMTMVTSSRLDASAARLPVELVFKAKSYKRTQKLVLPGDVRMSVQWALKGSYRSEHIVRYLKKWLPPWTPEREASADYRILFMDVAGSHCADAVVETAWSRGFVVLWHYGCTTGVAQVNDTDCHGAFERVYVELEQISFNYQQLHEPGSVVRRPQDVINDVAATWKALPHDQGCLGHYRNGLSVKLDGSEDHLLSRDAAAFWKELDMGSLRREALADVDAKIAAGTIKSFDDWRNVVSHPEDPGTVADEGAEFEGVLEEGEELYLDEPDAERLEALDLELVDSEFQPRKAEVVPVAPADAEPATCKAADRLNRLRQLRADAAAAAVPAAYFNVDREITQLERGFRSGEKDKKVDAALRLAVEKAAAMEAQAVQKKRAESLKERRALQKKAAVKAKAKALAEAEKKKKAELDKKLEALPKNFTIAELNASGPSGEKARKACLERLHLKAPALSAEKEARWPKIRDGFSRHMLKTHKKSTGAAFLENVNAVLSQLVEHYSGKTTFNSKGQKGGDPSAFSKFFNLMESKVIKVSTSITM